MRILLLDNYDPGATILSHVLHELGAEVDIYRNDEIEVDDIRRLAPAKIVLSSGPDEPNEAGIMLPLIRELCIEIPMLGIGLGHQAIAAAFGGRVQPAPRSLHHASLQIEHSGKGIFAGLPTTFMVTNASTLLVERSRLPDALETTAWSADGLIMGLRHHTLPLESIQFDPEPRTSAYGMRLLSAFLEQERYR
jgi:anthranilate synthase component 2